MTDQRAGLLATPVSTNRLGHSLAERKLTDVFLGTGTILDAWRLDVPMIVVPNTDLLNDHQTEMAQHLANEGYATQAKAEYVPNT